MKDCHSHDAEDHLHIGKIAAVSIILLLNEICTWDGEILWGVTVSLGWVVQQKYFILPEAY